MSSVPFLVWPGSLIADKDYLPALAGVDSTLRVSGTRNMVRQCWHLTTLPRISSDTAKYLRQARLGQINCTDIDNSPILIGRTSPRP